MKPPLLIQSRSNARIQHVAALKHAKARRESQQFLVEGMHEVAVALDTQMEIQCIASVHDSVFSRWESQISDAVETLLVSASVFEKMSVRQHPDGVLMVCRQPTLPPVESLPEQAGTVLVLDGLEKPGNHGAILRTAAAFGVNAVVLNDGQIDPFHPNVIRNSRGHSLRISHYRGSAETTRAVLEARGYTTCVASPSATVQLHELKLPARCAIILGAEHAGVSAFWEQHAAQRFRIAMTDAVDSLNVSVSASIVLYEVFKQQKLLD